MSEAAVAPEAKSAVPATAPVESIAFNAPAAAAVDCSPEQQVELRYLATLKTLVDDALEHRHVEILAVREAMEAKKAGRMTQ